MKIHIISIGGRIMHTLALNLIEKGHLVSGSDDEIYEPSKSRLKKAGVLPNELGWDAQRINSNIDLIILGMHARVDNPELIKAQELGLKIMSYPEFVFEESKDKKRIVVAGSHGKTSTTAMIMHVLKDNKADFDYLIGAELEGFGTMVKLTNAPLIIIEGDEYLSSCIDRKPKMMHYFPHLSVITGIAWDHINVFKTEQEYFDLFDNYIDYHTKDAKIFAFENDSDLQNLVKRYRNKKNINNYNSLEVGKNGNILLNQKEYKVNVFGAHNRANMMAALNVCIELGISVEHFFESITSFNGASKRLELVNENSTCKIYRDFAHAPSKLKASVLAIREQYKDKRIIAIFELHTFSSLNKDFLPKYKGSLEMADEAIVYYSEHTIQIKNMESLSKQIIENAFDKKGLKVISDKEKLRSEIEQLRLDNCIVVMMSSGTFDGIDIKGLLELKL